jgi:hypothetical protein
MKFSFPRRHGPHDSELSRLAVHLEHMAEAAALLRAGGVVRERIALVAADHLAEVLLQDWVEDAFVASEELGPLASRRYDRAKRQRLLADFSARVEFACAAPIGWMSDEPLLDARDASIFRVAHAYRNALYHGDRHNRALGRSLAVEYIQAAGRTLVRSWPPNQVLGGIAAGDARLRSFRRLGSPEARSPFAPRIVAEQCVRHLVGRFRVQRASLCRQLVHDIEDRAQRVERMLNDLRGEGLTGTAQADLVRAALLWAAYRADPELVGLQEQQDAIIRGAKGRENFPSVQEQAAYADCEQAMERRRDALKAGFRAPVSVATAKTLPRAALRLKAAPDTARLLKRYQLLDEQMRLLEQAVAKVASDVERWIQYEIDLARGK